MANEFAWTKLQLVLGLANSVEDIDSNIEASLQRQYIKLTDILDTESGAVSVTGSGPSLKRDWKRLRDSDTDIVACNASCQFLLERGIVPKYMFCFDADPLMLEFITPHPDITYLLASRCPPKAFEMLEGCKVVVWHAGGDPNIVDILNKHDKMEAIVSGGSASVTRCMMLVRALGYTEIHLWGADASFNGGNTHIRKSTTDERRIVVMLNNRVFETAPWMSHQVEDFKALAPTLRDTYGARLIVHGDGLIPHLATTMGFEVDRDQRIKYLVRETKRKAKILWQQL